MDFDKLQKCINYRLNEPIKLRQFKALGGAICNNDERIVDL